MPPLTSCAGGIGWLALKRGITVTNTLRHKISKAGGEMTLAVALVLGLIAIQTVQGQTFTVLHKFSGAPHGQIPTHVCSGTRKGISMAQPC